MSKLAITTISVVLLTASGLAANLAQANGHEDPQAVIEKLQQEKSVLLKRLNNAVAYSKDRGMQIKTLQAKADAEEERRTALGTRVNNLNAAVKARMDEIDALQSKNEAMSTGISSALGVSKKRTARLAELQALANSEQMKSKALSKRLSNAIAFSKTRGAQLAEAKAVAGSEQNKSKDLSNRLRNAIAFSKTRGEKLASAERKNKQLSKRLRNAIAYSKSRAQGADSEADSDWAANTSNSLNAAFGGVQGTTISNITNDSVMIQVGNNGLFSTGGTALSADGSQLLSLIAQELSAIDASATVVGHTDNIPVGNSNRFSSNEALSFARAVSTLQFLRDQGVPKERLSAAGYGADNPIAGNDTPEGRQQNRRVEIILRKE